MATKKKEAAPVAKAEKADSKKKSTTTNPKSDEAKAEKRRLAKERAANRPTGQRCNSKTIDIIELDGGSKVINYGNSLRKTGAIVTSVALDPEGNVISTSVCFIPGVKAKSKKEHGNLIPGVAGMGKKGKAESEEADEDGEE